MVPKYPRIFRNRFRFILVPKYSTTPDLLEMMRGDPSVGFCDGHIGAQDDAVLY